jgi:hypothetical protein
MMRDIDDTAKADALLMEHYFWQKSWREKLGYGNAAPECRQSRSSRQWDSTAEIVDEAVTHLEMEAVDWCMDEIGGEYRQAIGVEMRNREAKVSVWRPTTKRTYTEAVAIIIPLMRRKNLL